MESQRPTAPQRADELPALLRASSELAQLDRGLVELERHMRSKIERVPEGWRESARNLVHYVALRQHDLRALQLCLAQLGLSSLGRSESWVKGSLDVVARRVRDALGPRVADAAIDGLADTRRDTFGWEAASHVLHDHTHEVLGPRPADRHIYVMITAPSAKEADAAWMTKMLRAGMNVLRINCAHEGPEEWRSMVAALHDASREANRECRIVMDLAGPKIRTGSIGGARRIATWKPAKGDLGEVVAPARVLLRRMTASLDPEAGPVLLIDDASFASLRSGDELCFRDARDRHRELLVGETASDEIVCYADKRGFILERVVARVRRDRDVVGEVTISVGGGDAGAIVVKVGDHLLLTGRHPEGRQPEFDREGRVERPGVVACSLPAALIELGVGHRVLFDDGRIESIVEVGSPGTELEFAL